MYGKTVGPAVLYRSLLLSRLSVLALSFDLFIGLIVLCIQRQITDNAKPVLHFIMQIVLVSKKVILGV